MSFEPNLHHLIAFFFLAKERSFSKAAEQLSVTQSAVSHQIRGLEKQFGVKLVNIKKKRVYLTKAGERLLPYAEDLYNQALLTKNFLQNYQSNHISVGIASTLVIFLTPLIGYFKELHPSIRIFIQEGPSHTLVEELLDFKLDICFSGVLFPYNEKLRLYRMTVEEQIFLVAAPEYPLPCDKPVKWAQLSAHPLVIQSEGSAARTILFNNFKKRGFQPVIGAEVSNLELAKQLALQKKGVAVMFETNIREEIANGRLKIIRVEDDEIKMGAIDVLVNKEDRPSPAVEYFLKAAKKYFKGNLTEMPGR